MGDAVVVTGASTGIGAACALELDRRGCRVWAGVRTERDDERLRALGSDRLTPVRLDVTDAASIQEAVAAVRSRLDGARLAGLVNNAGIVVTGPLECVPLDRLRLQFEVNVVGTIAVTQAFLPLLRHPRPGRIVNMGSISGLVSAPYLGPYAASKYALEAASDALAGELRQWKIHVALIEPGNVKTPIWEKSLAAADRLAEEIDPAKMALYASDIHAVREAVADMSQTGMPVERVSDAIIHALFARRPRHRYPVGVSAHFVSFARGHFLDRLLNRVVRRDLSLK